MKFYCDNQRHLICVPYSVDNLHVMAEILGIKRCWFHNAPGHPHYDIPKKRIAEIQAKCTVISTRKLLELIQKKKEQIMKCKNCQSNRIVTIGAYQIPEEYLKASLREDNNCKQVELPSAIGSSDSIQFEFCADCGRINDEFPLTLVGVDEDE